MRFCSPLAPLRRGWLEGGEGQPSSPIRTARLNPTHAGRPKSRQHELADLAVARPPGPGFHLGADRRRRHSQGPPLPSQSGWKLVCCGTTTQADARGTRARQPGLGVEHRLAVCAAALDGEEQKRGVDMCVKGNRKAAGVYMTWRVACEPPARKMARWQDGRMLKMGGWKLLSPARAPRRSGFALVALSGGERFVPWMTCLSGHRLCPPIQLLPPSDFTCAACQSGDGMLILRLCWGGDGATPCCLPRGGSIGVLPTLPFIR
jgi:hypothetical protein